MKLPEMISDWHTEGVSLIELAQTAVSSDVRRKLIRKELRLKSSSPEFEERGASTQGNVIIFRTKKFPGAESDLIQRMFMLSVKAVEDEW